MATYVYKTAVGPFYLVPRNGRWLIVFRDDVLGHYATPQHAVDDLAGGHTFTPSGGYDTSALGIPAELGEWELVR